MKHSSIHTPMAWAAALAVMAAGAQAHVTLEQPRAEAGSAYKAVLRVGHGCDGSPTRALSVRLPAGFRGAKPMPKPGWTVTIRREALAEPYDSHGQKVSDDVAEITWQADAGAPGLPDAFYDEFVLRGQAPQAVGPAWFRVRQVCEKGSIDWAELPPADGAARELKAPAARLDLTAPDPHAGHAH
ncbi:YcnI family protein [Ideonella sp.]|uniref:YcnI family copper-binding membrane protein n=1 Tax=Ideonella sp. TaxID=1929293 RepID=UPI0035AD944E